MPVSLERLIAEVEPAVVTDELIRDCIVVSPAVPRKAAQALEAVEYELTIASTMQVTGDPESAEDKKQSLAFGQVECAAFSFRSLARIDNLWGLTKLVKLQLDNNQIQRIENLEHLVSCRCVLHTLSSTAQVCQASCSSISNC
jgi:hypothetical protein